YLEICSIHIHSLTQVVLETDRQTLSFSVLHAEDLEAMVSHMTASLKRIFPDSSPGKLLKTMPCDLQQRLQTLTSVIEKQMNAQLGSCGGFSDTYAALCDFNEMPFREDIQWDVDNIYYVHKWTCFNLQDFSHLDNRYDTVGFHGDHDACTFMCWVFDADQPYPSDQRASLFSSFRDFVVKMAASLRDHPSSTLHSINLSANQIEDKGSKHTLHAPYPHPQLQTLSSSPVLSQSLTHLDLSGNPGSLVTEDATFLFKFLSSAHSLVHLDLSDTNCPLDTVRHTFSLHVITTINLRHLYKLTVKVREVTRSIREFFSQSSELQYVGLSATKLPPQALRYFKQILQYSSKYTHHIYWCQSWFLTLTTLRSAGAQVIQEHMCEATAVTSLDVSDNGFENDMVTLVLSIGQCHSLRHLALGRNFAMKSRPLTDVLHRIAQLIQDGDCPLQSLSVEDSKLKTGIHILLSALGGHAPLAHLDISGNNIGDTGAKMVAKALMSNSRLRYRPTPYIHWVLHQCDLMTCAEGQCPRAVQRSSVFQCLSEALTKRSKQAEMFLKRTLVETTGQIISNKLRIPSYPVKAVSEAGSCHYCQFFFILKDFLIKENSCNALRTNIPELRLSDSDFPTDDYSPAFWRNSFHSKTLRPAPSIKSLLEVDWDRGGGAGGVLGGAGGGGGGGRCGLPQSSTATPLSVTASSPSPSPSPSTSPSPSPPGQRVGGRRRRQGEVVAVDAAAAAASISGARGASLIPPPPPLPTQGQTLRHYTASRPRPRRTHSQPPSSRTQAENEASEGMGRVDEGVEEFFTKKIIPDYALTTVTSPSAPPTDTCFTSTDAPLLSTSSTPPASSSSITTSSTSIPTKNIKKKFGDFFAFKRARAGRAAKAGGGEGGGGGGEAVKVKRTSIADLIRPLREAKERERERERDKEREKERGPRAVDDANVCNDAATTEGTAAPSRLTGDVRAMAPAKTLTTTTPSSEATPPHPATSSTPEPAAAAAHTGLQEETVSSLPVLPGPERMMMEMKVGGTPFGERRLKVTKRSLREGKSQSLILLTGLDMHFKHASENTPSFEQRLQVMLHRMGVAKTPPADTKMTQNKDEELRKANSEGAILDKPEPPPTYMKPRTMSTSSADPRHPIRTSDPIRPEPPLYPKPALPERPVGPLPPKPAIAAKPHLPTPATPAGAGAGIRPSSAPPSTRPDDGPPQVTSAHKPDTKGTGAAQGSHCRCKTDPHQTFHP
uniref:Capping protein regulator and myosin 1 linker 2 n=1 Tax=Sphaeramia orbicularis TaxID=375764 RepID=A0A672ZKB3_9TELE